MMMSVRNMAWITRPPQILVQRCCPSPNLNLNLKPTSSLTSSFLRFPKLSNSLSSFTLRRRFCSANSSAHESESNSIVNDLLDYLNESWTHFHATAEAKRQLIAAGFHLLNENEEWDLKPGGRYFFTRNMSCLVAFAVGEKYDVGNGFHAIAAHTDSPCLKLKPKTASSKSCYSMVNVQTYGAGLWHTWFDRDLSVAGRVILRSSDDDNCYLHKLVKVKRPILRIPTLAIHLDRTVNQDGFKPNLETHLLPLLSMKVEDNSLESKEKTTTSSSKASHHPLLMQVLSDELNCDVDDIVSIELNVCDTQPSCLGGGNNEFIFSGRLDNLASSYCALRALIDSCESPGDLASEQAIRMVTLYWKLFQIETAHWDSSKAPNNCLQMEEPVEQHRVGSGSVQGAGAPTMFQAMRRIVAGLANNYVGEGSFERTIRQSFLGISSTHHPSKINL